MQNPRPETERGQAETERGQHARGFAPIRPIIQKGTGTSITDAPACPVATRSSARLTLFRLRPAQELR